MRVTIFGSTGQVGRHLVERAVERDWQVAALARTPSKLGDVRDRVEVVEGNVQNADAVDRAAEGTDAVLSVVGHTDSSAGTCDRQAPRRFDAPARRLPPGDARGGRG